MSVKFNLVVKAFYVPGEDNNIADAVSRLHEPGQNLRLESLWNSEFKGEFSYVSFCKHMSLQALCVVFTQVAH